MQDLDRDPHHSDSARRFFTAVTARPRSVLIATAVVLVALLAGLPRLHKDTRADAFLPEGHPSLVQRDRVEEIFGLNEPLAIAVLRDGADGIYTPHTLRLVEWLTHELETIDGIDVDGITSLATESDVVGDEQGITIRRFLETMPASDEEARALRRSVERFPLYLGSLVGRDGNATLVVAELLGDVDRAETYDRVLELIERAPVTDERLHVAGEGAVAGYLSRYIDRDAQRMNPLAFLVVSLVLLVAYRTLRGVVLPHAVTATALLTAVGIMAWTDTPFYLISNGMLVLLIGVAVADGIHVLGQYYEEQALDPTAGSRELAIRSMVAMWRPVTITSLTDMAGFLALYFASFMPPMKAFGLFAGLGVFAALLFSVLTLPALLTLLPPQSSSAFRTGEKGAEPDVFGRLAARLGEVVLRLPRATVAVGLVICALGIWGATRVEVDEEGIEYFQHDEPIYRADRAMNAVLDGTHYLDVVLEAEEPGAFYQPERLRQVEELRSYLETLPGVRGATAITGHVQQIHRSLEADRPEAYRIPDDPDLIAQSLLLYGMDAGPTAVQQYVDPEFQRVHLRARLGSARYSRVRPAMIELERHLQGSPVDGAHATIAGRVEIDYRWMERLRDSHLRSVGIALLAVWMVASLAFRSLRLGGLVLVPVVVAVLFVYAVMGAMGIWLAVGTAMFAAIAIGTAVDFAVHTLDRLQEDLAEGDSLETALRDFYPTTARALLFNFGALVLGFLTLTISEVPSLITFGSLVAVAASAAFFASVTLLPALLLVLRPSLVRRPSRPGPVLDPVTAD